MPWTICSRTGCESFPLKSIVILFLLFFSFPLHAYERIVSLKPNLTEILFALGEGNKVVGVSTFCDYPPEVKKIDKVSDYLQPDIEKLISKNPDLIVTSQENSSRREIEFLIQKGYKVITYSTDTLEDFRRTVLALGKDLGKEKNAQALIASFDSQMGILKKKAENLKENEKKPRALFVVGQHPLVVAGSGNLMNEIAPYLGFQNAVQQSRLKYPTFSIEQLYSVAPDYIIDFAMGTESSAQAQHEAREEFEKLKGLPAIQNHQLYFWDISQIRASPRLPEELNKLFDHIYSQVRKAPS